MKGYLLKRGTIWNDMKRPETTCKKQETTWNELQQTRNDLERLTTSSKQPEPTNNKQKKTRNDQQQQDFEIVLQYGAIGSLL